MRHRRLATIAVLAVGLLIPATVLAASPIAGNDQAATDEDTAVTIDLLRNDSDPDGDSLHIQSIVQGAEGRVTLTPVAGLVNFAPNPNFNGTATFSYVVVDSTGATATALVMIFVNPVNDPPVASDRAVTVAEDGSVSILFQALDPDKERCDLVFIAEPNTAHGQLGPFTDAGCNPNGDMATAIYTPRPGYSGPDTISYLVSDGTVQSQFATVSITVVALPRIHVGDLDGSTVKESGTWSATATIRVDTAGHAPQAGAVVTGVWSSGLTGSCTTTGVGTCPVSSGSIARKIQSTTFSVTAVTYASTAYDPTANHDPDGDSNGTSIVIGRP
jgi:hypothetical protein